MELITTRNLISVVPARFKQSQCDKAGKWLHPAREQAYHNLLKLDLSTCSVEDIIAATAIPSDPHGTKNGLESWCYSRCDDCGNGKLEVAMIVGQPPDYESATAIICLDCARKAFEMLSAAAGMSL